MLKSFFGDLELFFMRWSFRNIIKMLWFFFRFFIHISGGVLDMVSYECFRQDRKKYIDWLNSNFLFINGLYGS